MKNSEIAQIFREISTILQLKGANVFRIRAYERAAQNIEGLTDDVEALATQGQLTEIPGIGKDLSDRITEYISSGKIKFYEDLKKSIPAGLLELLKIPSVGPKTAKLFYEQLHIESISDLENAIAENKLTGLFGIKEKTIENILKGIALLKRGKERMTLAQAIQVADGFISRLEKLPEAKKISPAGSLRRQKETVRDIDILVLSAQPKEIMEAFVSHPDVKEVTAKGETKASVRTKDDIQLDCRVVEEKSFGAALVYFTGSKNFNIKLRHLAIRKDLKVNEYGVFRNEKYVCGKTEEEVFKILGMAYVEPELREDNGEVELAHVSALPKLVTLKDIKGDLHVHSNWSDGSNSIAEMAASCRAQKYEYVAITDHSQGLKIANGLTPADVKKKKREIDRLNKTFKDFRILFGTEVDIDSDGGLDYPDTLLKEFDIVIAAVHTGFKQSQQQLTRRIVSACKNKYVHIIAHPTGRLWGSRDAYDIDLEEVLKACRDTNTALEINSFPNRLDLNDVAARRAKERGVRLAIDTDSHATDHLAVMSLGVAVARRGWLEKKDVLNALSLKELLHAIKK
jgi:DNA polymerase (family 10)